MTKSFLLASTTLLIGAFLPTAILAQESPAERDDGQIIITATKRATPLQDVPIAVSAVTGEQLKAAGVTDVRALQGLSPSLVLTASASEAAGTVARIRGVGTTGDNPGLESAVAIFIDGVYRNRNNVGLTELGEVERIELLRGPQGTLFGRNASAGLINVITKGPQDEFGGYGEATYGNFKNIRLAAGITGPLVADKVAVRLDGVFSKRDGFIKDVVTGQDYNDRNRWLLRGQVRFTPNDDISVRLIGDYSSRKEQCCAAVTIVRGPTASLIEGLGGRLSAGGAAGSNPYDRFSATTPGISFQTNVKEWGASGEVNWDFGAGKLTSITAYRDWQASRGQDADFTSASIFERPDGGQFQSFKTFSQELRLNGTAFDDKLDWLVGGYYANEKLKLNDQLRYGSQYDNYASCLIFSAVLPTAVNPTAPGCANVPVVQGTLAFLNSLGATDPRRASIPVLGALIANPLRPGIGSLAAAIGRPTDTLNLTGLNDRHAQDGTNYAGFTHNVINLTEKLSVTLGARYTSETKDYSGALTSNNNLCSALRATPLIGLSAAACAIGNQFNGNYTSSRKENRWSGTGVISYKATDDLLTYISYSKGYKGGGYNLDRSGLALNSTLTTAGTIGLFPSFPTSSNPNVSRDTLQFAPELVDAYELGIKYGTRAFTVNFAAFKSDFSNFQLNTFNGVNFVVENLPKVTSTGVELEVFARPTDRLTISGGITFADAKYGKNLITATTATAYALPSAANTAGGALFRLPGAALTNAPQYTVSGAIGYNQPIEGTGLKVFTNADFRYQSDVNTGSDLDAEKAQDGFVTVNGRIGFGDQDDKWGIDFFVRNLFDQKYQQVAFDAPLQGAGNRQALINTQTFNAFLGDPRTFGVTIRSKF
jgi:iron complex outermembrane recepter protein